MEIAIIFAINGDKMPMILNSSLMYPSHPMNDQKSEPEKSGTITANNLLLIHFYLITEKGKFYFG